MRQNLLSLVLVALPFAVRAQTPLKAGMPVCRVYPETLFQTMVGFGVGFNQNTLHNIDAIKRASERERAYDMLYGPTGLRLDIVRLTISPDARPAAKDATPVASPDLADYDWAADEHTQKVWKSIQPVLGRTKPILYAVPFTPPPQWKDTGKVAGGGVLLREHYREYAAYLASFLEYYHKVLHVDIDVLSLQNEPGVAAIWASCKWTGEELREFLKVLAPAVRARGLDPKFMLTEGTAWSGAWEHLQATLAQPEASRYLHIMASHSYGAPDDMARRLFAGASAKSGLPVWMSEMSLMHKNEPDDPGMIAALQTAGYLHRDLAEAHACAWIYCFAIYTATLQQGSLGILSPSDGDGPQAGTLVVPKRFWAMANYSRFVRPGWRLMRIDSSPGFANTAFIGPKGEGFVIVALNPGQQEITTTYDFGTRDIGGVEGYATTRELDLAGIAPPAAQPHRFVATLPPMSVTTFTGKLAVMSH